MLGYRRIESFHVDRESATLWERECHQHFTRRWNRISGQLLKQAFTSTTPQLPPGPGCECNGDCSPITADCSKKVPPLLTLDCAPECMLICVEMVTDANRRTSEANDPDRRYDSFL